MSIDKAQVVPVHAPAHATNREPGDGAADNTTADPLLKIVLHVLVQLTPAGAEVTVPEPNTVTLSV